MTEKNEETIDQRGIPTNQCFNCGSEWFQVLVHFEDYEIAQYMVEAKCALCDSELTAPTPIDAPNYESEEI